MFTRSEVIVLTNKQTDAADLKTSNALRYATTLGNHVFSGGTDPRSKVKVNHHQHLITSSIRHSTLFLPNYVNFRAVIFSSAIQLSYSYKLVTVCLSGCQPGWNKS